MTQKEGTLRLLPSRRWAIMRSRRGRRPETGVRSEWETRMPTLIEEMQRDCIDSTASVSFLLRKVKLAAGKLGVAKVEEWVDHELNGYTFTDTVPEYRMVKGKPIAWSPYRGASGILFKISALFGG
jgi:hypothetical protein